MHELFEREDAGVKMVEFYRGIDFRKTTRSPDFSSSRAQYIEMILARKEILSKLSLEERSEFKSFCVNSLVERSNMYTDEINGLTLFNIIVHISNMDDLRFNKFVKEDEKLNMLINEGQGFYSDRDIADIADFLDLYR